MRADRAYVHTEMPKIARLKRRAEKSQQIRS